MKKFKNNKTMVTKEEFERAGVGHSFMTVCPECGHKDGTIVIKSKGRHTSKDDEWLPRWLPGDLCPFCAAFLPMEEKDKSLAGMALIFDEDNHKKILAGVGINDEEYDTIPKLSEEINPDSIKWHHGMKIFGRADDKGIQILRLEARSE